MSRQEERERSRPLSGEKSNDEQLSKIDLSTALDSALKFSVREAAAQEEYRPINEIRAERDDISQETRQRWQQSARKQKEAYVGEANRKQEELKIDDAEIRRAGEALVQRIYSLDPAIRIGTSSESYHRSVKEYAREIVQTAYDKCVAAGISDPDKIIEALTEEACKEGRCQPHGLSEYAERLLAEGKL